MRAASLLMISLLSLWTPAGRAGMLESVVNQKGKLERTDQTLQDGSWADVYPVDLEVGDRLLVEMQSNRLDTYVAVRSPSNQTFENDDSGAPNQSMVDLFAEEAGTWLVYATSSQPETRGRYHIRVAVDSSNRGQSPVSNTPNNNSGDEGVTAISPGQTVQGRLQAGDRTLANGEWTDLYSVDVQAGQRLVVDMSSTDFDTYIGVRSPSGSVDGNDDHDGDRNRSRFEGVVEESGQWTIFATSYSAEERGDYALTVDVGENTTPIASGDGLERWSGILADGDDQLSSGEYVDKYRISGNPGEHWVIDLRSAEFDPFLIFKGADGEQQQNDDFEGASDRSLLDVTLGASGEQLIAVTSYRPGMGGRYDLSLRRVSQGSEPVASSGGIQHTGTLAAGDEQLSSGEWFDVYTFEGLPGQHVVVDLRGDFDTYVGLIGPGSFKEENDDAESGERDRSVIEAVLTEAGTHRVIVTSYEAGQGGSYQLSIQQDGQTRPAPEGRDVVQLSPNTAIEGTLAEGDMPLDSGEYSDRYVLDLQAGQPISVSLRSTDFDPYVGLVLPDGSILQNDDWEGDRTRARIDLDAPMSGRYRVIATSYRTGETGRYQLEARVGDAAAHPVPLPAGPVASREGRIYGVFVGISDYPDNGPSDLDYTADDARHLYEGMQRVGMQPQDGRLLVDRDATRQAVLDAIAEMGEKMTEGDKLVVFYSGHGGRINRADPQSADPDGYDETLALYDAEITDDEMAAAFDGMDSGTVLLVLDSCFSGGFSKDVISQPGRMGLFSSHEDVTSAVAHKFRAGGYLARFMVEALGEHRADMDTDGSLTALELSQYLYERYRSDVKSTVPYDKTGAYDDIVMTGRNLGYQQLIVDRGGVGPSQILFAW